MNGQRQISFKRNKQFCHIHKEAKGRCAWRRQSLQKHWGKKVAADCYIILMGEESEFRIYPDYRKIYRGKTEIILSKAEYELFILLSGRPGVIFTKEKIFEILYNEEVPESIDNIIYCLVSSMRKKIEPEIKKCQYIKTVRGVGYKFEGKRLNVFP